MQLNNPLQMNDWGIKKFLTVVTAVQLAMWGVIGLDAMGLKIPILREFVGFIYLTFIPGIILLRFLKLHKLSNIETLLYTVGLSIATLMFTGLFMNTVYPVFGIDRPISLTFLIITISIIVLLLCIMSYVRDKDFSDPSFVDSGDILFPPALFLCLIPFLAVFGTYLANFYHNNILLMFLIVILAVMVLLIAFDKFIPKNLYPLAVFIIAISLLYHTSLISMYIWGTDIQFEHYLCNLVKINSIWDSTIHHNCNAMLSLVMLSPIYSIICDTPIHWVFKIIYPFLFSLVPLGLYRVFQKQTDDKVAFLSCFFFVSLFVTYAELTQIARQQISEIFFALLMLLMVDKNMNNMKRTILFIPFAFSLAVSHYGLSYVFMFSLIVAWTMLYLNAQYKHEKMENNITSTFVLLYITFALTWYMYVSSSSVFESIICIGEHIANSIFTDFLNPEASQGLYLAVTKTVSPLHEFTKVVHIVTQFFIIFGIIALLLKRIEIKFEKEYVAFSMVNFIIYIANILIPYFSDQLKASRMYQITLFFLSPFFVIGGIMFFKMLTRVAGVSWTNESVKSSLKMLSVILVIFLLCNTGFIYEVAKDNPTSIALSNLEDAYVFNEQEVISAKWLSDVKSGSRVHSDRFGWLLLCGMVYFDEVRYHDYLGDTKKIPEHTYIYLRSITVKRDRIKVKEESNTCYISLQNSTFFNEVLIHRNKIYANGGSEIYR